MTRAWAAWLIGLAGTAGAFASCRLLDVGNTVTALCLILPIAGASAVGGRTIGLWTAGTAGVAYAAGFLPPFGHVRVGLTDDMLALVAFLSLAMVVGSVSDRRRPPQPRAVATDPTPLLNAVSHDLRNPLSTIRAASSDLLNGTHAEDSQRQAELLGLLASESERMDRIVRNLLSAGCAQSGTLQPHLAPESPADLLQQAATRLGRLHAQRIVVDVDDDLPEVLADQVQIDQVLSNLVENAARVCPADSTIAIRARWRGNEVIFEVLDGGPGFGELLGDPFEAYRSTTGSSGLGLAICKAIVTAHGGAIEIVDVGSSGACVRFSLPAVRDAATRPQSSASR